MENPNCGELDQLEKTLIQSSLSVKVKAIIRAMIEASDALRNKVVAIVPIKIAQQADEALLAQNNRIFRSAHLSSDVGCNVGYLVLDKNLDISSERNELEKMATSIHIAKYAIIIF